jgi:hypothetical protein
LALCALGILDDLDGLEHCFHTHDGSMVLLYMVTWIPSIYPSHVSIYSSTMDPMGYINVYKYVGSRKASKGIEVLILG